MKRQLIILIYILTGCSYVNTDEKRADKVESYKEFFYDNREIFERIVGQINSDERLRSRRDWIKPEEFDESTLKQLRRLEIRYVTFKYATCDKLEIEFTTDWTEHPIGQMYITKTACEDPLAGKGNYWNDGNFIEVWGLGEDWLIWIDSDFI